MADWYNYEISIEGAFGELEDIQNAYALRYDLDPMDVGYLRVNIEDVEVVRLKDTFLMVISGQCAWDEAEDLARQIKEDARYDVNVSGLMQGGWEPMRF